jgi:LysM repeat protein
MDFNRRPIKVLFTYCFFFLISVSLMSCASSTIIASQTPTGTIALEKYQSQINLGTDHNDNQKSTPTPSIPFPTLTKTPIYYIVEQNDTLSSIAYRYQVKLSDLLTANPDIDPNFLTIGISITIPTTGSQTSTLTEPTPIPINLHSPNCFPQSTGGLFCILSVTNTQPYDVENITANIILTSPDMLTSIVVEANSPLNLLKKGESTALTSYIPPPIPANYQVTASLTSVLPVPSESSRYMPLIFNSLVLDISENGNSASISGRFGVQPGNSDVNRVWILGVAYDNKHRVVGIRKWIFDLPLPAGESAPFQINVYSLGPQIEKVDILYEAVP